MLCTVVLLQFWKHSKLVSWDLSNPLGRFLLRSAVQKKFQYRATISSWYLYCGIVINQLINLQLFSFQGIVTSLQFKSGMEVVLSEISPLNENKTGMTFHLTLCKELSKHMSIFTTKKCILIFQSNLVFCHTCACLYSSASYFPTDIPFTVKSSNEVHFELASTSTAALILVKHIGQTLYGWPFEDFHSLVHASERKSTQCNVWAVVRNSVKVRD